MKVFLRFLFFISLCLILWATIRASLDRNIMEAISELGPDKWFQATLVDTYLAFLTFYCWVFYKESKWISKIIWFFLIIGLGNIAIAGYMLIQLWKARDGSAEKILLRN